jgi:hypothetical protein
MNTRTITQSEEEEKGLLGLTKYLVTGSGGDKSPAKEFVPHFLETGLLGGIRGDGVENTRSWSIGRVRGPIRD